MRSGEWGVRGEGCHHWHSATVCHTATRLSGTGSLSGTGGLSVPLALPVQSGTGSGTAAGVRRGLWFTECIVGRINNLKAVNLFG